MTATSASSGRLFTVVIASLCDDARIDLLKRAVGSVRAMAGSLDYCILIIANGPRVSPRVLEWIATQTDIRVIRLRSGSHPLARRIGVEIADSEFVGFVDDDDELEPDTLARKIAYFREHPEVDVLVTDGWRINGPRVTKVFPPPEKRSTDLVETLMRAGWGAGAVTLRMQRLDLTAFDTEVRHVEWTLTTLELARRFRFGYLDETTYRYYETTPDSLSKCAAHIFGESRVWRRLAHTYAGTPHEATARRNYLTAGREASWELAYRRKFRDASRIQLESLRYPGGLRSLPFTARLLFTSLRRVFA